MRISCLAVPLGAGENDLPQIAVNGARCVHIPRAWNAEVEIGVTLFGHVKIYMYEVKHSI